jgi:hypothetical protein
MKLPSPSHLQSLVERQVQMRTGRRVRNLAVELMSEAVILRGSASTYYIKQLAQHGVREVLPQMRLENAIVVEALKMPDTARLQTLRSNSSVGHPRSA